MNLNKFNDQQWDALVESIINELYPTDPSEDIFNVGGWITDLEAGDATIEEVINGISGALNQFNAAESDQAIANENWIGDIIRSSLKAVSEMN